MSYKVFRDAVHDMISFHRAGELSARLADWGDPLLLRLIDTSPMQRLRRIRQLGLASQVYPSAEHSRFSHSLGVCHLAKRVLHLLTEQDPARWTAETVLMIKTAALLHDIGHGPYSHVFEHLYPGAASHESWGWRILTDDTPVHQVIINYCQEQGIDANLFLSGMAQLWGRKAGQGMFAVGRQLIASQLDVDRMDYLLRDAHFTGVIYGRFDLEWLLRSLEVVEDPQGSPTLCIDVAKGPAALENYLTARDQMYRQVYDHKTVRAFEALLAHLFLTLHWIWRQADRLPQETPPELARFLQTVFTSDQPPTIESFLALDDGILDYAIAHWAALTVADHLPEAELRWKCRLLLHRQPVYRRIFWRSTVTGNRTDLIRDDGIAHKLEARLNQSADLLLSVAEPDGGVRQVPLGLLVLLDRLERSPYSQAAPELAATGDPIRVRIAGGGLVVAEEASDLIRFLGQQRRHLARLFVDPRAVVQVGEWLRTHCADLDLEPVGS